MQTNSKSSDSDTPIDLTGMDFGDVLLYFDRCKAELVNRSILRPETIDQILDIEFRSSFEEAPRALRRSWGEKQEVLSRIHAALTKAENLSKKLTAGERCLNKDWLDDITKARVGSGEAAQEAMTLSDMISAPQGNPQADVVAKAIARAFQIEDRPITFGRAPNSREPSTDFGRTVQLAIEIFRPEGNSGKIADWTAPAQNAVELVKSG